MTEPLNPVLKAPIDRRNSVFATKPSAPRRRAEKLERLSMPESFALINWLQAYKVQPGDSVKTMAVAAASALGNPKINENHVRQRMEEFGLTFPSRLSAKALSAAERLAKLEQVLATAIREQLRMCGSAGVLPHPDLLEFVNSTR